MSTLASRNANDLSVEKSLTEAIRRYCRSVELCDGYLRGYYGLKIVGEKTQELLNFFRFTDFCRRRIDYSKCFTKMASVMRPLRL